MLHFSRKYTFYNIIEQLSNTYNWQQIKITGKIEELCSGAFGFYGSDRDKLQSFLASLL
jgi:hypothetical protein